KNVPADDTRLQRVCTFHDWMARPGDNAFGLRIVAYVDCLLGARAALWTTRCCVGKLHDNIDGLLRPLRARAKDVWHPDHRKTRRDSERIGSHNSRHRVAFVAAD